MKIEDKQIKLYSIVLESLKVIPILMALCCVCGVILSLCGYDFLIWSILGGPSILPLAFLYLTLYAFNFSTYYRVFLHYIVVNEVFACIEYLYGIPISNNGMAVLYITIICIFFFIILYLRSLVSTKKQEKVL